MAFLRFSGWICMSLTAKENVLCRELYVGINASWLYSKIQRSSWHFFLFFSQIYVSKNDSKKSNLSDIRSKNEFRNLKYSPSERLCTHKILISPVHIFPECPRIYSTLFRKGQKSHRRTMTNRVDTKVKHFSCKPGGQTEKQKPESSNELDTASSNISWKM